VSVASGGTSSQSHVINEATNHGIVAGVDLQFNLYILKVSPEFR